MPATWDPARVVTNDHVLPYIDSNDPKTPEASRQALNTLPFERNVFKLLANSPLFFPKFMALLGACFSPDKSLRPSEWQLAVLLTSRALNAPYEWDVNWPMAKQLPAFEPLAATEGKIAQRDLSDRELFSDRQRLVARFCEELNGPKNVVSETTMRDVKAGGFTDEQIMELFMIVGVYSTLARMMNSCRIDYDEDIPGLEDILRKTFAKHIEQDREALEDEHAERS